MRQMVQKVVILVVMLVTGLACYGQDSHNLSVTSQSYDEFFLEAMMQRQKGNNDAAFDLLHHCLEINPDAAEAHYFIAQYCNALKDTETAMTHIQRAAELAPENETYMETLAQAYREATHIHRLVI